MENIETIFNKSLKLHPSERFHLMEMIAKSLDQPNESIEEAWAEEVENRYNALEKGEVKTIQLSEIFCL